MTTTINPDAAFIEKHYDRTIHLLDQFGLSDLRSLVERFAEEYALCPASSHRDYHSAFPGGLAYHNLHVLQWVSKFAGIMGAERFSKESLLKISILRNFGKVGVEGIPYYVKTNDDWKIRKGIYYDTNPDITYMKIPQRSLYLAQESGVHLTEDEYLAVLLSDGHRDETNAHYRYKEPDLATVLEYAAYWARKTEEKQSVSWP